MRVAQRHGAAVSFTCVEMRDSEHPPEAAAGPQALLAQVVATAAEFGVPLTGENALQRCAVLFCVLGCEVEVVAGCRSPASALQRSSQRAVHCCTLHWCALSSALLL